MAKIRLRMGSCEVEIESGDFCIDNRTAASVIDGVAKSLQGAAAQAGIVAAPEEGGTGAAGAGAELRGRAAQDAGGKRPLPRAAATAAGAASTTAPIEPGPAAGMQAAAPPSTGSPRPREPEPRRDLSSVLDRLDEAEMFEPEFDEPRRVRPSEVAGRLGALAAGGYFETQRTVTETVAEMAEHGWLAGPLDVSKELARMAMGRQMRRESRGYLSYYCSLPPDPSASAAGAGAAAASAAACPSVPP